MNSTKPKRHWWQFSLRSILLLTLAVALWLGYEVRQARQVERTIIAIRALGGDAESEPTGWSLLRLCRVPGYGQHIVRAEIPGVVTAEAVELLRYAPHLREVRVTYDGALDPTPSWRHLNDSLTGAHIVPVASEDQFKEEWLTDESLTTSIKQRLARIRARAAEAHPDNADLRELMSDRFDDAFTASLSGEARYHVCLLEDRTLVELLLSNQFAVANPPGTQTSFVILLVGDQCVGMKQFSTGRFDRHRLVLEDMDHDGIPDVGFEYRTGKMARKETRTRNFPGDPRNWLGVYKVERDGFKSLLGEDKSDFP